jgi:hypothetical protein
LALRRKLGPSVGNGNEASTANFTLAGSKRDSAEEEKTAGYDNVLQDLVAVGEVFTAASGLNEPHFLLCQESLAGVLHPDVVATVGRELPFEAGGAIGG